MKLRLSILGIKRRTSRALCASTRFTLLAAQVIRESSTRVLVVSDIERQLDILVKI